MLVFIDLFDNQQCTISLVGGSQNANKFNQYWECLDKSTNCVFLITKVNTNNSAIPITNGRRPSPSQL